MPPKAKPAPAVAAVATPPVKRTRFLVRRATQDVYIWTEELAKRTDLEEVWAPDAPSALNLDAMPDPRNMTLGQLEDMSKEKLILFGKTKLGLDLDGNLPKDEMLDQVKVAMFTMPSPKVEEFLVDTAKKETRQLQPGQLVGTAKQAGM